MLLLKELSQVTLETFCVMQLNVIDGFVYTSSSVINFNWELMIDWWFIHWIIDCCTQKFHPSLFKNIYMSERNISIQFGYSFALDSHEMVLY